MMKNKNKNPFFFLRRFFTISRLFLIPAFIFLMIFVFYPIVATVYTSFFSNTTGNFIGLGNYDFVLFHGVYPLINVPNLLQGTTPLGGLINNFIWIAIHLPVVVLSGMFLAVLLRDVKGGTIIKSIVFLGVVIPLVVGGVLFRFIFDKDAGIANAFLSLMGLGDITRTWYAFADTALLSIILGSIWIWTGFGMIVYSAGLQGIPVELYEAAEIDGASRWKTFWRITVPMLRSTSIVVVTMTVLWELKIFDIVYVVTRGGPGGTSDVLAYEMYNVAFFGGNYAAGSAIAVLLTLMTIGFAAYMVTRMSKP
jgi:multiple sugar transport system permease protein